VALTSTVGQVMEQVEDILGERAEAWDATKKVKAVTTTTKKVSMMGGGLFEPQGGGRTYLY
jgi:hypothetical protein